MAGSAWPLLARNRRRWDRSGVSDELVRRGKIRPNLRDPFALPRGLPGRLAGRMMARSNAAQQREVVDLLAPGGDVRLLEIGYGPGELAALALARDAAVAYAGVDPSEVMQARARQRNAGSTGRSGDFRIGAAAELPFPDGSFDIVVAVNNVRLWPDIGSAAQEVRRVLVPDGMALVTWHGGRTPSWLQRRLAMSEEEWSRVEDGFRPVFGSLVRRELPSSTAIVATEQEHRRGSAGTLPPKPPAAGQPGLNEDE